jgi:PAS domain S-box-containing protein
MPEETRPNAPGRSKHDPSWTEEDGRRCASPGGSLIAPDDLQDLFENGSIGIRFVAANGTILAANQAELELFGYEASEFVGHNLREFHSDERVFEEFMERLSAGQTLHSYEAQMRCKDGRLRYVSTDSSVKRTSDGRFLHTRSFTHDITDRRRRMKRRSAWRRSSNHPMTPSSAKT